MQLVCDLTEGRRLYGRGPRKSLNHTVARLKVRVVRLRVHGGGLGLSVSDAIGRWTVQGALGTNVLRVTCLVAGGRAASGPQTDRTSQTALVASPQVSQLAVDGVPGLSAGRRDRARALFRAPPLRLV